MYEADQNQEFLEELYSAENLFAEVVENSEDCLKKLGNLQTMMEGIINYYSKIDEIEEVDAIM